MGMGFSCKPKLCFSQVGKLVIQLGGKTNDWIHHHKHYQWDLVWSDGCRDQRQPSRPEAVPGLQANRKNIPQPDRWDRD
jgi:hypothetical protein